MRRYSTLVFILLACVASSEACADFQIEFVDGSGFRLSDADIVLLLLLIALGAFLLAYLNSMETESNDSTNDLPEEVQATETAEQYEQEAVRLRARARKLDDETTYRESELRAKIKEDEVKEIEALLRKKKPRRGA